jgi:hypothetical protein
MFRASAMRGSLGIGLSSPLNPTGNHAVRGWMDDDVAVPEHIHPGHLFRRVNVVQPLA